MINLEDIDTKENLIQDFYRWLFDNNNVVDKSVILEKEVDISLAPYYTDPQINSELSEMFEKSHQLEEEIRKQLGSIGFKI